MSAEAFSNTRWSLVQQLHEADLPLAERALDELCQIYWQPLYAFVRRSGRSHHEAQDLTQGFFARLLETKLFERADAQKSRLRNYLLASLKHYLINDYHHTQREKRGGKVIHVDIDPEVAEASYNQQAIGQRTPEQLFDREWALTLLCKVMADLDREMTGRGQGRLFAQIKATLVGETTEQGYRAIGKEVGLTESAVKVAVHRLRRRYRQLLRREVSDTLSADADPDEELNEILAILRS